jgi:predicted O-methyltransferase YrrM
MAELAGVRSGGQNPFDGVQNSSGFKVSHGGWNSYHPYLHRSLDEATPGIVIEIGVWKGGSVITLAEGIKARGLDAQVIAIDTFLGSSEHWIGREFCADDLAYLGGYPQLYYRFAANVFDRGVDDTIIPLPLDSINALEVLRQLDIRPDILHIDGGHDFRSVMQDLESWWPFLKPNGILVGDDYFPDGRFWSEVKRAYDTFFGRAIAIEADGGGKCFVKKPG